MASSRGTPWREGDGLSTGTASLLYPTTTLLLARQERMTADELPESGSTVVDYAGLELLGYTKGLCEALMASNQQLVATRFWHDSDSETDATTCHAPTHIIDTLRQITDSAHVDAFQATFTTVACGIGAIFHVMAQHGNHADLQEQGCGAMCKLTCNNDDNKATLVANGGITVVVKAMRQHGDHVGVQEQGCVALLKLARSDKHKITIAANRRDYPCHATTWLSRGCARTGVCGTLRIGSQC
jgi:hypothetical protein